MSKLTDIVNVIVGKTKSIKKELIVLSDQFIVEREVKTEQINDKVDNSVKKVQKSNLKVEPIGNTEQLSGMSEKPNNHIKIIIDLSVDVVSKRTNFEVNKDYWEQLR